MASQPQGRAKAPKAKVLQGLRNTQAEQLSKLQQKYQFEQDLLEDIRAYCKQRSALEKEYSQNLQKLNSNFLQKRAFSADTDVDSTHRLPDIIWKKLLEESENYSKKRLEVSDGLQTKVVEEIKTFKANKAQVFKKCQDLSQKIQEEVFETAREMSKSKKAYIEAEKLAQVASEQAADAEDKLKNKNKKFFQSKATLEKNLSKTSSRKEFCEKKATTARNDYLLNIAATNAHMTRYYCTDLQEILDTVYGTYYETIRDCFLNIGKLEAGSAISAKNGFEDLLSEAGMIEKDYCVRHFLQNNPVFTKVSQYDFEPWKRDKVLTLSLEGNAGLALNKEARKLSMRYVREQKTINEKKRILSSLSTSGEILSTNDPAQDPEQNPDNIKEEIRKSEVIWLKSDACLNLMKDAGVNVDEWLRSANSLSVVNQELSTSQTSLDNDANTVENSEWNDDEWDMDDTFAGGSYSDDDANSLASSCSLPSSCVALYSFEASTSEELSIVENEELEVIEKDGEGWCKGRNKNGDVGYFPESYVDFKVRKRPSVSSTQSGSIHSGSCTDGSLGTSPGVSSSASQDHSYICLVRALYDYEAVGDDEISFNEGDIIKVTRKDEDGVDDGFWEGQVNGQFGMFPSLLVEEIEGPESASTTAVNTDDQDSIYSVPSSALRDDYIELPKGYVPGTSQPSIVVDSSQNNTSYIQPIRKAPEPPSFAMDRRRVQTENLTTMKKPDLTQGYQRAASQEYPQAQASWNSNVSRSLSENTSTANYVNVNDFAEGNSKSTGGKPPKPPPPTANSRRTYSKSAV